MSKTVHPGANRLSKIPPYLFAEIDRKVAARPKELNGRKGPEPTRYDDWEKKGIASDF